MRLFLTVPRLVLAGAAALALGGCANFSEDGGMAPVASRVSAEIGKDTVKLSSDSDAQAVRERVSALLKEPLTPDAAVQIALISNRGLQAEFNALGISEAAFVEASLPPNPTFSFERITGGGALDVERRIIVNLLSLLTLPVRRDIAESRFRAAQYKAIEATFRLAAETRRAYYRAVAAQQLVGYLEKARLSANAAADLSRKLGESGASSKLNQARAGSFQVEVSNQLARARMAAGSEREALTRELGVWAADADYKLPGSLSDLPANMETVAQVEAEAIRRRVDLIAARIELDATARALGLTDATRFVSLLELSGIFNYERSGGESSHPLGFELAIQIPIFDLGEVGVRRAREVYMQALNRLVEKAVDIRSEARSAYRTYHASYDIARQYKTSILPLRKIISEEAVLQYNGMLIDEFELLTTVRETIASSIAAIEARRDFFIAEVDFQAALIGGGGAAGTRNRTAVIAAPAGGGGH
ncbi:MAG: TolC family protein [Alphaproteobacteria bacterium]|nr:TolC family protein [Alphaproteobacteria bacterium]